MFVDHRIRPSFLIIGGVKCASSSLYRYLINHPNILPCSLKETGYFSNKGLFKALLHFPSYLQNFPKRRSTDNVRMTWYELEQNGEVKQFLFEKSRSKNTTYITGEATATYNFDADPKTVKWLFPKMKIIALVREPTERYISHYKMFQRFHQEGRKGYDVGDLLSFVKKEICEYNQGCKTRILHQGLYYQHLFKWVSSFGKDRLFLEKSESLINKKNAAEILDKLTSFLCLPSHDYNNAVKDKFNVAPPETSQNSEVISLLKEFYHPHNKLMFEHFGIELDE